VRYNENRVYKVCVRTYVNPTRFNVDTI